MTGEAATRDRLLGGRVELSQPRHGFRTAIDAVLLAAAVPARAGERALDLGTGTGAAALCLARRVDGVAVTGLDADADLIALAAANVAANGFGDRVTMLAGDLGDPPAALEPGSFHHALANPPHLCADRARASPRAGRAAAMVEGAADLDVWVRCAAAMVRPRGSVTFIHRADRLDAVLAALAGHCGDVTVFPLWPGPGGRPAKRILVSARAGSRGPLRLLPGLVLHDAAGRYTPAAEAVLRHGEALALTDGA